MQRSRPEGEESDYADCDGSLFTFIRRVIEYGSSEDGSGWEEDDYLPYGSYVVGVYINVCACLVLLVYLSACVTSVSQFEFTLVDVRITDPLVHTGSI